METTFKHIEFGDDGSLQVTEALKKIVQQSNDKQVLAILEYLDETMGAYKKAMKLSNGDELSVLYAFYQEVDNEIIKLVNEAGEKGHSIKCKKGCAFCCHINVDVTNIEAVMAYEHAKDIGLVLDIDKLRSQAVMEMRERMFAKESACVFLNEDNECSIYRYRPFACRKYLVESDPALCDGKTNKQVNSVGVVAGKASEVIASMYAAMKEQEAGNFSMKLLKLIEDDVNG